MADSTKYSRSNFIETSSLGKLGNTVTMARSPPMKSQATINSAIRIYNIKLAFIVSNINKIPAFRFHQACYCGPRFIT